MGGIGLEVRADARGGLAGEQAIGFSDQRLQGDGQVGFRLLVFRIDRRRFISDPGLARLFETRQCAQSGLDGRPGEGPIGFRWGLDRGRLDRWRGLHRWHRHGGRRQFHHAGRAFNQDPLLNDDIRRENQHRHARETQDQARDDAQPQAIGQRRGVLRKQIQELA